MEIKLITQVKEVVVKEEAVTINLEYPVENKYYRMMDDGNFFPRGDVLFAIIVKHASAFNLFEIERGRQFYTDFVPTKDCRQEYWLKDSNSIRRTALEIMLGKDNDFDEITFEEFKTEREKLLNFEGII